MPEVESLGPWWASLRDAEATLFQNFDWNLLALRTFSDETPYFVVAESDSSLAILPSVISKGEVKLAGGRLFDYPDALCAGDESAFRATLEALSALNLPLSIAGIRGKAGATRWSAVSPQQWTGSPFVSARNISAGSFAAEHPRGRRTVRRLRELGATIKKVNGTPELVRRIYREKAKEPSRHGPNVFRDERCVEFMTVAASIPRTRCELFVLKSGDTPIAALVTFIDGNVRRFYTTWMDFAWNKHSPGIALLFEATRQTLEQGIACDYMTGEQSYKLRFATGSEPLYKVEAQAEQLARLASAAEETELKAA